MLQGLQSGAQAYLYIGFILKRLATQLPMFDLVPHLLIGIEFR